MNQCALAFIRPESWRQLEFFRLYRDFGAFPNGQSTIEQTAEMIDAFRIFQSEMDCMAPQQPLTARELIEILNAAFGGKR